MSRAFISSYRDALTNIDVNTKAGLADGSIMSQTNMAMVDKQAAQLRKEYDTNVKPIIRGVTESLMFLLTALAKAAKWINEKFGGGATLENKVNASLYREWADKRGVSPSAYSFKRNWKGEATEATTAVEDAIRKYGDVYDSRISPEQIRTMGMEQYYAGQWLQHVKGFNKPTVDIPAFQDVATSSGPRYTDSLLQVGNFLGQTQGSMDIATSILANTKVMADNTTQMNDKLTELVDIVKTNKVSNLGVLDKGML
jgi:hypothetical protein